MKILFSRDIDRDEWNRLVRESATGTWFQTPEAYDFFGSMPDLFKPFVVGIEAYPQQCSTDDHRQSDRAELFTHKGKGAMTAHMQQTLRAVCSGYVTVEKNPIKQFFTRRAIIIGGPALADDCTDEEVSELMKAIRNGAQWRNDTTPLVNGELMSPIYIETRNFNDYSRWRSAFEEAGFAYQPHLNYHVDTSSVEIIDAHLGKSRKRDIRTTIREGVSVVELTNERVSELERERMVREYYEILKNLYETKVKTPLFPESFFQTLAKHKDARFLLTALDGKIIGGTVCVAQEGKCLYEWFACGEDGVYPHVFPSCYATYAGIRYAAEHGMPRFDMMGAGKPDEAYGVREFKAKFGGKEVEHGRFVCITKPLLYKIGVFGVKLLKKRK